MLSAQFSVGRLECVNVGRRAKQITENSDSLGPSPVLLGRQPLISDRNSGNEVWADLSEHTTHQEPRGELISPVAPQSYF